MKTMWAGLNGVVIHSSLTEIHRANTDAISVDPPWRQGNLTYWSRKANTEQKWSDFTSQVLRLCDGVKHVHLKVGRPESKDWMDGLVALGFSCSRFETTYYAGLNSQIIGSRSELLPEKCAIDSKGATETVIQWAVPLGVRTIYDPCIGLGKMAKKWTKHGAIVFGTELIGSRAAKAAKRLGLRHVQRLTEGQAVQFVELAKKDGVAIHPEDINYGIPGIAIGGLSKTGRRWKLRGCWVHPGHRNHGLGRGLVLLRWFLAWSYGASAVESFVFRPALFEVLGFGRRKTYKMGSHKMVQEC